MKHVVTFENDNDQHQYYVDGIEAVSVTQVLQKVGISKSFDDVPDVVKRKVKAAAEKGNYYDRQAEEAVSIGDLLTEWQERFLKAVKDAGLELKEAQVRFGTLSPFPLAGTADFKGINTKTKRIAYVDLKATYMIYTNSVTWQTNTYGFLDKPHDFEECEYWVVHYNETDDKFIVLQLKNISQKRVHKMLATYQLGDLYVEDASSMIQKTKEFENLLVQRENKLKEIEETEKKIKEFEETLLKTMEENGIEEAETENFKIKYSKGYTRTTVGWTKILNDRNEKNIKKVNDILELEGYEPLKVETEAEVKKNATEEEKEKYSSVANVKSKITITPIEK